MMGRQGQLDSKVMLAPLGQRELLVVKVLLAQLVWRGQRA